MTSTVREPSGLGAVDTPAALPRSGLLVACALAVANVLAYALNVVVSRWMGPAEFGAFGALLGITIIGSVPALALQPVAARHAALAGDDRSGAASLPMIRAGAAMGIGLGILTLALTPLLVVALHLGSPMPVLWLALALVPAPVLMAGQGLLQGQERFRALTVVFVVAAAGRFAGAVVLVHANYGVSGAMAGIALASVAAAALTVAVVRPTRSLSAALPAQFSREVLRATTAMLGLFVLANADVLLARHFLPPTQAGIYAVGAVVAKVAFWGPQFVTVIAFPRLANSADRRLLLRRALGVVTLLGAAGVTIAYVAAGPLLRFFVGGTYDELATSAWLFAAAGAALALVNLLLFASLAVNGRRMVAAVAAAAAVEVLVIVRVSHQSARAVIVTVLVTALALTAAGLVLQLRPAQFGRFIGRRELRSLGDAERQRTSSGHDDSSEQCGERGAAAARVE